MVKLLISYSCSSVFCGQMIVARARVRQLQISGTYAKARTSYGVAYKNLSINWVYE